MADEPTAGGNDRAGGGVLPTGTVTFLFTDIAGSTRLLREHRQVYAAVLAGHRNVLRAVFAAHDGREVDTQGDAFFVAFSTPGQGVAAAVQAQRALAAQCWPDGVRVLVRMGLHTGEATVVGDGYVGLAVHRAARVAAAASGGQVLVSDATAALVGDHLPTGTALRNLGEHQLKDFPQRAALYQLDIAGLPTTFPPPRTTPRHQPLPVAAGTLLGRDADVSVLASMLTDVRTRLVTVTGSGGIGKTRLAVETARTVAGDFPGGVVFVPLSAVVDHRLVLSVVADAVDARLERGVDLLDAVRAALGDDRTLVVLDNFEQVVEAAGDLALLLDAVPAAVALVTSRQVLRLRSEQQYSLAPLAGMPAERLFAERAAAVRPGFTLDDTSSAVVAEICRRLDGLPLAIELAAARVRLLPPAALLARLSERLDVLGGGPVDLPERQRTLRATMDWSFGLLRTHEQAVFTRLGVFSGGWTLRAAETVCGRPDEPNVLDALAALLDASLLVEPEESAAEPRLHMLDTVRAYAVEKLGLSPDRTETERRHTEWVLTDPLVSAAARGYRDPLDRRDVEKLLDRRDVEKLVVSPDRTETEQHHADGVLGDPLMTDGAREYRDALDRFDREWANVRASMRRAIEAADVETAALLLRNTFGYLARRDAEREALGWLDQILPRAANAPKAVRGRLLILRAVVAGILGDVTAVRPLLEEGHRLLPDDAEHAYDHTLAAMAGIYAAMAEGSVEQASRCIEETAARSAAMGQELGVAFMAMFRATLALRMGDLEGAERHDATALQLAGRLGDDALVAQAIGLRGLVQLARGDVSGARRSILDAASANRRSGLPSSMADSLEGLAAVALADRLPAVAARALAAAAAARRNVATTLFPALAPLVDGVAARSRELLGDQAYEAACSEGRELPLLQALDRTVEGLSDPDQPPATGTPRPTTPTWTANDE